MILLSLFSTNTIIYIVVTLLIVVALITISTIRKVNRTSKEQGIILQIKPARFYEILGLMLLIALGIVLLLKLGLENNVGVLNHITFMVFPYAAFAIFLIGSIYRYRARGFQVSSLSSEFLERKKLFWGSQPFHWGLMVLFFGHLIAFLFPRSVIIWNGEPVRLLILEISSFAFGLAALIGLILLIKRRLSSNRILVVTNKMDMLVYTTLLVQLISGLGVAYYARWGSSWFAGVLTPYLRSIFAFNPDISGISAMPWYVQIHVFSAFFIIAIIPFTRFMHFLVAPIDYLWRRYQLVIWNWSRKAIRNSRAHSFGKKSKNN